MNKLKMKAKAGVTLVELLVVILIVTILSVSMLPLLQPFVTESQYAAEAIPVIGNLRTKIGMYVYEKGHLPYDESKMPTWGFVETWDVSSTRDTSKSGDVYVPALYTFSALGTRTAPVNLTPKETVSTWAGHIQGLLDVDYQDLKGKRSKPVHYQYLAISTNTSSYVVGCFGNGNGLKAGTGYAVCELNFPLANRKLIGTWKRYKSYNDKGGAIAFSQTVAPDSTIGKVLDCYIPPSTTIEAATAANIDSSIINPMVSAGWEF